MSIKKLKRQVNKQGKLFSVNKVLNTILDNCKQEKDVIQVFNNALNTYLDLGTNGFAKGGEFDSQNAKNEKDLIAIMIEKAMFIVCCEIGKSYTKLAKKSDKELLEFQKKIDVVNFLYKYQLNKYGKEILEKYGYDIVVKTESGGYILQTNENITEEQLKEREKIKDVEILPIIETDSNIN